MCAQRVMVGISGGVDSAVAAHLLIEQGYAVAGLFMKNWDDDDGTEYCTAGEDLLDAERVCHQLGIDLHTVSFSGTYREQVFAHFLAEYAAGRTPNPDVLCNREIKFSVFAQEARRLGADLIATGHYARVETVDGARRLLKGVDPAKDQSYFLQAVSAAQLANVLFPLGARYKCEVRSLAEKLDLPVARKRDSTGICFIGERRFREFLARYLPTQPGSMQTAEGVSVGQHAGVAYYTVGQREGLGIGGSRSAGGEPWYVAGKDAARNTLTVVAGSRHPALHARWLSAGQMNWLVDPAPASGTRCTARIRYRQADQSCRLQRRADGTWLVEFDTPQRAISPGQYVCLYDGDLCLGGGVIEHAGPPATPD